MSKLSQVELADRINAAHALCVAGAREALDSAREAVSLAIEVGGLLDEAKSRVRHGEWSGWVAENCRFGLRQAQGYLRAYRNREAIEAQMRSGAARFAGLHGALESIASPATAEPAEAETSDWPDYTPARDMPPDARHRMCEEWWDIRAGYAVLLDAAGWETGEIAEFLSRPTEDIEAILDPRPAARFDTVLNGRQMLEEHVDSRELEDWYASNVEWAIERLLERRCDWAAAVCDHEGFAEAGPILRAWKRRHKRRREAASERAGSSWPFFLDDDAAAGALFWCVSYDVRHALRINVEGDADEWSPELTTMFARQLRCFETAVA